MASEDVDIRLRLERARQFVSDTRDAARGVEGIGSAARRTAASAKLMGGAVSSAARMSSRGLSAVASNAKYGAAGLGALALAGAKWGLSFNAQVESARLRFELFTKTGAEAKALMDAVSRVDMTSAFNLAGLSDATALLGNAGVSANRLPQVLQGVANAAAASGKGQQALDGIALALSQIQAKGRLSQEEINQLNEAGAPGAQRTIQKAFGLTKDQLQNLGGAGLDATKAVDALTRAWTSGRMAKAAERQIHTLGGQWDLLTGNMQKLSGAATAGLAHELETTVTPAANRATQQITEIFGRKGLSNEQKLREARKVINREIGPIAEDAGKWIESMHLDQRLGEAVEAALPAMTNAAVDVAPHVASAFVNAWIHSGPWAQLATVLFVGKKGLDVRKWGRDALGKGGGALGGVRGMTPASPLFVSDVGGNFTPGGQGGATWLPPWLKAAGPAAATAAVLAARAKAAEQAGVNTHAKPTGSFVSDVPANIALGTKITDALGLTHFRDHGAQQPVVHVNLQSPNVLLDGVPLAHRIDMAHAKRKARSR